MKKNKKVWLNISITLVIVTIAALFLLFKIKEKPMHKDFVSTPDIESVFDTLVTDRFAVVFYKKGCPYCEAAQPTVLELAKQSKYPVYYIDTESSMGKKLIPITKIKYASTVAVFKLQSGKQLPISQVLFSNNPHKPEVKIERWSYADRRGDKYIPLTDNIQKALEITKK